MSNCKLCLADCAFSGKDMKKGTCKGYIPMTNADRIRAVSDEELAKFLCNFRSCDSSEHPCNGCQAEPYCMIGHNGMIDWLQQPAEEDT